MGFLRLRQGAQTLEEVLSGNFEVNYNSPQAAGLVAWYPMLASRGMSKLRDMGGRGLDGTFGAATAAPTWAVDSKVGAALNFDGTNDYVDVGDVLDRIGTPPFSISAWANIASGKSGGLIVSKYDGANVPYPGTYNFHFYTSVGLGLQVIDTNYNNAWIMRRSGGTISTATWYHLVGTYGGGITTTTLTTSINGIPMTGTATSGGTFAGMTDNSQHTLISGRYSSGSPETFFPGLISDVRFYNIALPPSVIWQMANAPTVWDLYMLPRRWWALKAPAGGVPGLWPRLASIGSRGKPYISPDFGVSA